METLIVISFGLLWIGAGLIYAPQKARMITSSKEKAQVIGVVTLLGSVVAIISLLILKMINHHG